jgi:CDP-paratose 2-epimerase
MSVVLITGSAGLIGSEATRFFCNKGFDVIGIDNDLRSYFFGIDASTESNSNKLISELKNYTHHKIDIRDKLCIDKIFKTYGSNIELVIHTAAQPSHDWAAKEPFTDFEVNVKGTLNLLEATRLYSPNAVFIFTSTNKVYGDTPNYLPLIENKERWEIDSTHSYYQYGIDESMSIDNSTHSLFGANKLAADILVQEYGRYFGLTTAVFRGGCLTGPAHSGAQLHGFLSYLISSAIENIPYTIFGYKGKQVRDNIHSWDLVQAFWHYFQNPRKGEVYNIGGSRYSNISVIEAINKIQNLLSKEINYTISNVNRIGDHIWYISDVRKFKSHYPQWCITYSIDRIINEMVSEAI